MYSFNAKQINSLDCIELHCLVNCCFAVHCNVLDWTAPPTLHYTALHWVKFEISCYYKNLYDIFALLLLKSRIRETPYISNNANRSTYTKKYTRICHWKVFKIWIVSMNINSISWTALNFTEYQIVDLQCTAM